MEHLQRKVRIAAIGYGNRVRKYLKYILDNQSEVELCSVVDIDPGLLDDARRKFSLPKEACFRNADDFFASDICPDGVIIGTPDNTHYDIAMKSIEKGFHILLEKPIAQTMEQCMDIDRAAKEKGVQVIVCYVLRYHPYYMKLKELLSTRILGELVSINHIINVGIDRTTHSYVRGIWSNSSLTNPMILSKSCHDADLMLWLSESKARKVTSFGSLKWFRAENAPQGSSKRCIDCKIEQTCPFSAIDLYIRRKSWISNFRVPEGSTLDEILENEMKSGDFGRCVYHCDNDVVDNQIVSMIMENNVVVTMSMDCFTLEDDRLTTIKCVYGEIIADATKIKVRDFRRKVEETYDFTNVNKLPLHANADLNIVADFIHTVRFGPSADTPTVSASVESHKICFLAEEDRLRNL